MEVCIEFSSFVLLMYVPMSFERDVCKVYVKRAAIMVDGEG